jgi:hypothetical protein
MGGRRQDRERWRRGGGEARECEWEKEEGMRTDRFVWGVVKRE